MIHIETFLIHTINEHERAKRKGGKKCIYGVIEGVHDFSAFLSTKNRSCWGPLYHRVCSIRGSCTKFEDQQLQRQLDSKLHRYEAFTGPDLWAPHYWCTHEPAQSALDLTILRTCRQVYQEAKLIPYHTNTFAFDSPPAMARFCMGSLQGTNHPWNEICRAVKMPRPSSKRRIFSRKGSAKPSIEASVSIPVSEIRSLRIHAAYHIHTDPHDWNNVCFQTAHLWTGLQELTLNIDVIPYGEAHKNHWIQPNSGADFGFRAYQNSPLRRVTVDVSDKYRHVFFTMNPFGRRKAHYWSTSTEKEEFENGIRDCLMNSSPSHS